MLENMLTLLKPTTITRWISAGVGLLSLIVSVVLTFTDLPFGLAVGSLLMGVTWSAVLILGEVTGGGGSRRKQALITGGYSVVYVVGLVVFSYWFFPWDRVRDFVVQEVERPMGRDGRRRPSGLELEIEELSPSWITGIEMTNVTFRQKSEDPEGEPIEIGVDELTARVSLLSAIMGETSASYDLEVGGGSIEGEYSESETQTVIRAELERVDLERLGIARSAIGLPVTGRIDGSVDLTLSDENSETTGSIGLEIADLAIGDGEEKLKIENVPELTVERIDVGRLTLAMSVEDGVARVEELGAEGEDLHIAGTGSIRMVRPLKMSRLDLLLRMDFQDAYKDRNDRTRGLFSLLELTPQVRPYRTTDGAIQIRINGSPGSRVGTSPAGRARMPRE